MSIRHMIPMGTFLRKCVVCGYPIQAKSHELTVHELRCLNVPEKVDNELPSPVHYAPFPS